LVVLIWCSTCPGYHGSISNLGASFGYSHSFSDTPSIGYTIDCRKVGACTLLRKLAKLGQLGLIRNTTGNFYFMCAQNT
jgi:hypothetical protein